MVGFTAAELNAAAAHILKACDLAAGSTTTGTSVDDKFPTDRIAAAGIAGIAIVAGAIAESVNHPDLFLFVKWSSNLPAQYQLTNENIDDIGPIVGCQISFDSGTSWDHAQEDPDGPTALARYARMKTAGYPMAPLRAYSIHECVLYLPALPGDTTVRGRVAYVPGDVGEATSDIPSLPMKYRDACLAAQLRTLFAYNASQTGLQAAQHFDGILTRALEAIRANRVETIPPVTPYRSEQ